MRAARESILLRKELMHSVEVDYTQSFRGSTGIFTDPDEVFAVGEGYDARGSLIYSMGRVHERRTSSDDPLPSEYAFDGNRSQFRTGTEENWIAVSQAAGGLRPFLDPRLAVHGQIGEGLLLEFPPWMSLAGVEMTRGESGDPLVRVLTESDPESLPVQNPADRPTDSIDREYLVNLRTGIIESIRTTMGEKEVGLYEALDVTSVDVDGNEVFFVTSSREINRGLSGAIEFVYDIALDHESIEVNREYTTDDFTLEITPEDTVYAVDIDTYLQDSRRVAAIRDIDEALSAVEFEEIPRPDEPSAELASRPAPEVAPIPEDETGPPASSGGGGSIPILLLAGLGLLGIGGLIMVIGKKR